MRERVLRGGNARRRERNLYFRTADSVDVDLAFDLREGRVWIPVRIQDESIWAILDTGSDGTAVDVELAERLGLPQREEKTGSSVAGQVDLIMTGPATIALGPRELTVPEVALLPLASQIPGLQAILGFDALRDLPFTLDYRTQRLQLDALPSGPGVRFVTEGEIRPTTWLVTLGERFEALLDTGSAQGVSLPLQWIETEAPELLKEETQREILGDPVRSRRLTLDAIRLGDVLLNEVQGEAVTAQGGSFAAQGARWANVGNAVLARLRVGIDGRRRRTFFEPAR